MDPEVQMTDSVPVSVKSLDQRERSLVMAMGMCSMVCTLFLATAMILIVHALLPFALKSWPLASFLGYLLALGYQAVVRKMVQRISAISAVARVLNWWFPPFVYRAVQYPFLEGHRRNGGTIVDEVGHPTFQFNACPELREEMIRLKEEKTYTNVPRSFVFAVVFWIVPACMTVFLLG
jgi:hypothetical protein